MPEPGQRPTDPARLARWVWALCLGVATCVHVSELVWVGWAAPGVPIASALYWNSLTVLDPLAAALLFLRPRAGVVLTLAIMLTNVAHNVWAVAAFDAVVWMVVVQAIFLAFVLATARLIWRAAPALGPARRTR